MREVPGIWWIAAGAVLWGTDTVLRRPLTGDLGPTQIVFYEHLILALAVAPIIIRSRSRLHKIPATAWFAVLGTAWIGSALATVLFTAAVRSGNPTTAVLLQKTQPVFAIVLARLILGESAPARFLAISAAAVVGGYLIAFGGSIPVSSSLEIRPALLAVGAAAGWGSATVWGRIATRYLPVDLLTGLRVWCALPVLWAAALLQRQATPPPIAALPSLVWLALVPGFAALMLYYRGLRKTRASDATIAELAFPATAGVLNWLVLGSEATMLQIAGFFLIWSAISRLSTGRDRVSSLRASTVKEF